MPWEYLHFKNISEPTMKSEANPEDGETALQAFLNMYGDSNWELVHVGRPTSSSYDLIFKQHRSAEDQARR